jgi:hypothetical protein
MYNICESGFKISDKRCTMQIHSLYYNHNLKHLRPYFSRVFAVSYELQFQEFLAF